MTVLHEFCGPFSILKTIEQVAYELRLLNPKYHGSFLRKYELDSNHVLYEFSNLVPKGKLLTKPEKILKVYSQ